MGGNGIEREREKKGRERMRMRLGLCGLREVRIPECNPYNMPYSLNKRSDHSAHKLRVS
jgi:hypothetical protein